MIDSSTVEAILADERARLVRLCARLSGTWDAAEDLAQETLLRAWRHIDRLQEANQAAPWLSGIARNVCLEWSRSHYREQKRLVAPVQAASPHKVDVTNQLAHELEFELERQELVTLLDQALARLPPETRAVLIQRYVEASPYAEIAARLGLSENAVAVRAFRGKLALQRILVNELHAEAVAYGLLHNESYPWVETCIWCPRCGNNRLLGRFQKSTATGAFELRCPACNDGAIASKADLSIPFYAELLGSVKTYKPAFSRLLTAISIYCRQALASQAAPCLVCGHATSLWLGKRSDDISADHSWFEVHISCRDCHWMMNSTVDSFALILPEAQQFWRAYPRLCILPTRSIEVSNTPAFLWRLRSVTSAAGLDIISLQATLEIIGIHAVSH